MIDPVDAEIARLQAEISRLSLALTERDQELVRQDAVLEAVRLVTNGEPASDFMASFPEVRAVVDVRQRAEEAESCLNTAQIERDQAREARDTLQKAVETVLSTFTKDEAQGYHSKDRQYAIEILSKATPDVS